MINIPLKKLIISIGWSLLFASEAVCAFGQPASESAGNWVQQRETSQLYGTTGYFAVLDSVNKIPNSIGDLMTAGLAIRCEKGRLEAYIAWPLFVGTRGVRAHWKFDDGEISDAAWSMSEDGTATFIAGPRDFLTSLSKSQKLIVDVPPYNRTEVEAVFSVSGADKIVERAFGDCPAR